MAPFFREKCENAIPPYYECMRLYIKYGKERHSVKNAALDYEFLIPWSTSVLRVRIMRS